MGAVYRVDDVELGRPVALKVLSAPDPDGSLAERMIAEARILARLEHPGIVPVHDVGRLPDGRVFYVMKQVRGQRLDRHALELRDRSEALRIVQRISEAVAFAHAHGIIHRDLKPQNVMVGEFGEVLVLDWGIAKLLPSSATAPTPTLAQEALAESREVTLDGTRIGTPGWMAPEQAAGDVARIDARTDVYGLGAILAFLVTQASRNERGIGSPDDVVSAPLVNLDRDRVPRSLRAIIRRALAPDPDNRYPTVAALAEDINHFLGGRAVSAYREGPLEKAARVAANYRTAVVLVATYMILRVILLLIRE